MKQRVAHPPVKPLVVYDGECRFCCRWIGIWERWTGDQVDYFPSQNLEVVRCYPEIPLEAYDRAVQLIEVDGIIYSGAEAVFRSLAYAPGKRWLLRWYQKVPGFAWLSETGYRFVARNRSMLSRLTLSLLPESRHGIKKEVSGEL